MERPPGCRQPASETLLKTAGRILGLLYATWTPGKTPHRLDAAFCCAGRLLLS